MAPPRVPAGTVDEAGPVLLQNICERVEKSCFGGACRGKVALSCALVGIWACLTEGKSKRICGEFVLVSAARLLPARFWIRQLEVTMSLFLSRRSLNWIQGPIRARRRRREGGGRWS